MWVILGLFRVYSFMVEGWEIFGFIVRVVYGECILFRFGYGYILRD